MFGRDEFVDKCFEENPDLLKKGIHHVACWFFIQGELESSTIKEAALLKAKFYKKYLTEEALEKADKEWASLNEV